MLNLAPGKCSSAGTGPLRTRTLPCSQIPPSGTPWTIPGTYKLLETAKRVQLLSVFRSPRVILNPFPSNSSPPPPARVQVPPLLDWGLAPLRLTVMFN